MTEPLAQLATPPTAGRPRSAAAVLGAISWIILVTAMFGGYSLLRLLTTIGIDDFEEQFFRAGHGHAGILVAVSIIYSLSAAQAGLSYRTQVAAYGTFLAGTLIMSGGFFVHMVFGKPDQGSFGTNVMVPVGALILAAAIVFLAVALFRGREREPVTHSANQTSQA